MSELSKFWSEYKKMNKNAKLINISMSVVRCPTIKSFDIIKVIETLYYEDEDVKRKIGIKIFLF